MAADAEDVGDLLPDQEFGDEVATLAQCHGPYLELGLRGEAGRVPRGNPAERHRLAKLAAGAGIFAAEGGLHVVAADVEAWNRGALRVQHPGMDVGAEAAAGAERRRQDRKSTRLNSSH